MNDYLEGIVYACCVIGKTKQEIYKLIKLTTGISNPEKEIPIRTFVESHSRIWNKS